MRPISLLWVLLAVAAVFVPNPSFAQTETNDGPVVHGVFFFSPTCPHCELVLQEHLPDVFWQFGGDPALHYDETAHPEDVAFYRMTNGTLDFLLVNVSVDTGGDMYVADIERLGIPDDRTGVPRLDIGEVYLVGSVEIPEALPGLVEQGLSIGGVAWPTIPGIEDALASIPRLDGENPSASDEEQPTVVETLPVAASETISDRVARDPLGNGLAIAVLVGLVASVVTVPVMLGRGSLGQGPSWMVPVFAGVGTMVSIYLGSVEATGVEAMCGPVGDCNAVQQSQYASVLGIPIGILGVVGYVVLLLGWISSKTIHGRLGDWGAVTAFAVAFGGTLFSIYLTFLEPFIIGATCMWCLASALCIVGLLWLTAAPGWAAVGRLRASRSVDV
jgi:uncharacterized membrane protein